MCVPMPQGVEQQGPRRKAFVAAGGGGAEEGGDAGGVGADLGDAGLGGDEGAEAGALGADPGADGDGEALLGGEGPGLGHGAGQPLAEQPLAAAVTDLHGVGQAEGGG